MRIVRITVTDDHGVDHTWEGIEGHATVHAVTEKRKPYQRAVDAHLLLPAEPQVTQ